MLRPLHHQRARTSVAVAAFLSCSITLTLAGPLPPAPGCDAANLAKAKKEPFGEAVFVYDGVGDDVISGSGYCQVDHVHLRDHFYYCEKEFYISTAAGDKMCEYANRLKTDGQRLDELKNFANTLLKNIKALSDSNDALTTRIADLEKRLTGDK